MEWNPTTEFWYEKLVFGLKAYGESENSAKRRPEWSFTRYSEKSYDKVLESYLDKFLRGGGNINGVQDGKTLLDEADNRTVVKWLLRHGADPAYIQGNPESPISKELGTLREERLRVPRALYELTWVSNVPPELMLKIVLASTKLPEKIICGKSGIW